MHLSVTEQDKALIWCLKRPERLNALGPTIGQELLGLLKKLQDELTAWRDGGLQNEPPYRCLVLTAEPVASGRQGPVWVAGGDLKELELLTQPEEGRSYAWLFAEICVGLQDLPIPVVAVIDGLAIGGGVELALAADLRIATRRSALYFKQLEAGLTTGYGSCQRLVALVGLAKATDLLLRCRCVEAEEAYRLALFNELVDNAAELEDRLGHILLTFNRLAPASLATQKTMLQLLYHDQRGGLAQRELDLFETLWMQPAHKKFLEGFRRTSAEDGREATQGDMGY